MSPKTKPINMTKKLTNFEILPKHVMIALWTKVKITLVLWEVFLLFLAALEPKHKRPAKQIGKAVINTCNQMIPQFISL